MGRTFSALLVGASFMTTPVVAQSTEGVVMRRPIPTLNGAPGIPETGTDPAPVPTPTPSPTPAPTPGPPPIQVGADDYFGWTLSCSPAKLSCMHAAVNGTETQLAEIDPRLCPTSQDGAKNDLASQRGWIGIGLGITRDTGTSACGSPTTTPSPGGEPEPDTGTWPRTAYLAQSFCDGGTTAIDCMGLTAMSKEQSGGPFMPSFVDASSCISQDPADPFYKGLVSPSTIAPGKISSIVGQSCTYVPPPTFHTTNGTTCEGSEPRCMTLRYRKDGSQYTVDALFESWDDQMCEPGYQDTSDDDLKMLRSNGLTAPGGNACSTPSVYAATGQCVNTTTYDAGWPTSGQAHVDYGFKIQCYAVRNAGTPDMITSKVPDSFCNDQRATPAQQEMLAALAPTLQDPATMNRACTGGGGTRLNYQRDIEPLVYPDTYSGQNSKTIDYYRLKGDYWASTWQLKEETYEFPFVCTDVDRGTGGRPSYFDPYSENGGSAFKSSYPLTRSPCAEQHLADVAALRDGSASVFGQRPMTTLSLQDECRAVLDYYGNNSSPPNRVAQCGISVETNSRDTMTVTTRRWTHMAE